MHTCIFYAVLKLEIIVVEAFSFKISGFESHSGRHVVSLGKTYLPPKSTDNTQEAEAPSQHD